MGMRLTRIATLPSTGRRLLHDVCTPGRLGAGAISADAWSTLPWPLQRYLRALHERPMAMAVSGAGCAAFVGDCAARLVAAVAGDAKLPSGDDVPRGAVRTAGFVGVSAALVGVGGEIWYRALLRKFPDWTYHVALRTILDQSFFSPVALGLTVMGVTLIETASREQAGLRLRDDWLHHLGKMWTLWGGGSVVSYLCVPTPWQPPFALGLACVWSTFVSYRIHRPLQDHATDQHVGDYLRKEQRKFETER